MDGGYKGWNPYIERHLAIFVNCFCLERTNQLSLLPDKDLVDLCPPIEPYQVTKNQIESAIFYWEYQTMEPISLIFAALTAGAVAAAKDTAEQGVKDTYQGLKTLIKRKFANDPLAQAMVEAKPEDIKKDEGLLKDKIVEAGVDKDNEITKLAQDLLDKLQEQPGGQQIITQNISLDTDRIFRAWQERLRGAMGQWQKTQGDEGSWLRGAALAEAEEQLKKRPEDISQSEQDFIKRSLQERERIKQAEAARRRREIRTAWRIAAGSLVALVVSTGSGLMAWQKTQQGELNLANARGFSSLSLSDKGKELDTFVEAIKAGKTLQKQHKYDEEVTNALQQLPEFTSPVLRVSFSPDGKTLVSGSGDGTIKLWNVETGEEIRTLRGMTSLSQSLILVPTARLW
jgi:disulfide oxidoreductase YuzD